jgi:hypothetical protein
MRKYAVLALLASLTIVFGATARADGPHPPPAAFEACKDKKVGDACSVSFMGHTLSGTCVALDKSTVCKPDGAPGG